MVVHLLWIVNQSGQLIYTQLFTSKDQIGELGLNPDLHINVSSAVFSMFSMTQQITPNSHPLTAGGMNLVSCAEHNIHVYETVTLVKLILITDPATASCTSLFNELHLAYVEYVMKNPFHVVDEGGIGQPIRNPAFTEMLKLIVDRSMENSGTLLVGSKR
jgi:hypothetical protein